MMSIAAENKRVRVVGARNKWGLVWHTALRPHCEGVSIAYRMSAARKRHAIVRSIAVCSSVFALLLLFGRPALAQDAPKEEPKTLFSQLFPQPTGTNGYEDLAKAYDLTHDVKFPSDGTLFMEREFLDKKNIHDALRLVHQGLAKPIDLPPNHLVKLPLLSFDPFETSVFKIGGLSNLLYIEIYVYLAYGRTDKAIDSMRDWLYLEWLVRKEAISEQMSFGASITVRMGNNINAVAIIARKIDRLSIDDCQKVCKICEDYPKVPSLAVECLEKLRDIEQADFKKDRTPDKILDRMDRFISDGGNSCNGPDDITPQEIELHDYLTLHPDDVQKLFDKALESAKAYYDAFIEQAKRDAWERKPVLFDKAGREWAMLGFMSGNTYWPQSILSYMEIFDEEYANLHLLGTHAAICRFRWIHDRLPDTLDDLRELHISANLTLDPFTGKPLCYKRTGDTYDLHSAGSFVYDENGQPTKKRMPLYLPRRENQTATESPAP